MYNSENRFQKVRAFCGETTAWKADPIEKNRETRTGFLQIAQNETIRFVTPSKQFAPRVPYGAIIINLAQKIKGFFEKIVLTAQKTFCIIKKRKKRTEA